MLGSVRPRVPLSLPLPIRLPGRALALRLLLCCAPLLITPALAYDGFTVGLRLAAPGASSVLLSGQAILPIFVLDQRLEPVQFSARADLSYAVGAALPALSVTALLSDTGELGVFGIERYLGLGLGLGVPGAPLNSPLPSVHLLTGVRVPVLPRLRAVAEFVIAGHDLDLIAPGFSLGVEYDFGGGR